ncbi:MAG: aminofutalosine deaminase family hydrolase [Campylobacterales bacterium]
MKAIGASFVYGIDKKEEIERDKYIVYDTKIKDIVSLDELNQKYPNIEYEFRQNILLMPPLSNPHLHLEFSNNSCKLQYGEFTSWLGSIIKNRATLSSGATKEQLSKTLDRVIKSGTLNIGAISSFGADLEVLANSSANVAFFNETLGSDITKVDESYKDALARYEKSLLYKSERFKPSISIHSPYSTHPELIKKVLSRAKEDELLLSVHFLESLGELEWMDSSLGALMSFFENFFGVKRDSFIDPISFIKLFSGVKTLFIHNLYAKKEHLDLIKSQDGEVITCPRSNRLLNSEILDIDLVKKSALTPLVATDGLSSNISLDMFEELRYMLFMYEGYEINTFAKELLCSSTKEGARVLGFTNGVFKKGFRADFLEVEVPDDFTDSLNHSLDIILHSKVKNTYIEGKKYGDD